MKIITIQEKPEGFFSNFLFSDSFKDTNIILVIDYANYFVFNVFVLPDAA